MSIHVVNVKAIPGKERKNNKCTVTFVPTEYDLLIKLVSLVFMNNPDVLFGWEIEKKIPGVTLYNAAMPSVYQLYKHYLDARCHVLIQTTVMI